MSLSRILAIPIVADNREQRAPVLAERITDLRPLWLLARGSVWTAAALAGATWLAGLAMSWSLLAALLVAGVMLEAGYASVLFAESVVALERRVAATALAFSAWSVLTSHLLGGVSLWGGPLMPLLIIVLWLPLLYPRTALLVTVVTVGGSLAVSAAEVAGWVPMPEAVLGLPTGGMGDGGTRMTVSMLSLLILLPVAWISYQRGARQRAERASARRTVARMQADLDSVATDFRRHRAATADDIRQREDLEQRNRHLSVLNAVSFALGEPLSDAVALERSVRLVARVLDLRLAQLYIPAIDHDAEQHVIAPADERDDSCVPLPLSTLQRVAQAGRPYFSGQATEDGPVLVPVDDEAFAITPLATRDGPVGALAVKGPRFAVWADADRQLMLLVAREMASAVQNHRLYTDAIERAAGEAVLNDFARALSGEAGSAGIEAALPVLGRYLDAISVGVVGAPEEHQPFEQVAAWRADATAEAEPDPGAPDHDPLTPMVRPPVVRDDAWRRAADVHLAVAAACSDRPGVAALGVDVERPVPAALAERGVGTAASTHIVAAGRRAGAVVVVGGVARRAWTHGETEVLRRAADLVAQHTESEALLRLQSRRIRELSGLTEVAEVLQSTVDLDRVLNGFAGALYSLARYRRLHIVRAASPGIPGDVRSYGEQGRQLSVGVAPHSDHPWFSLRGSGEWSAAGEALPGFMDPEDAHGFVVPLRAKGQSFGFAVIVTQALMHPDVRTLCEQAFGQLSLALDSVTLYRQATERAARIQVQGNLARIVASVLDLREAFDAFSEEVRWLIPFDRAVMLLVDAQAEAMRPYATYPDTLEARTTDGVLPGSLVEPVVASNGPMLFRRDHPEDGARDWTPFGADAREVAAVPVHRGQQCVAVFTVVRTEADSYDGHDLAALEEVARLLAVSMERIELFKESEYNAHHDLLTGLPNYRFFEERVHELDPTLAEYGAAALVIDLDNMKIYNDSRGHAFGDRVLQTVAQTLRGAVREGDFVARTGGDEFVVLMDRADAVAAAAVAERVHRQLAEEERALSDVPTPLRLSIGIAVAPEDGATVQELVEVADRAMYEAKFAGGGRSAGGERAERRMLAGAGGARPNRLIDGLIRAAVAGATPVEREALSVAQHCALSVARMRGVGDEDFPLLRLLVSAGAAARLEEPEQSPDRSVVLALLGGLEEQRRGAAHSETGALLDGLGRAAVELAWLVSGAPDGQGMSVEAAVSRLSERAERLRLSPTLLAELGRIAEMPAERSVMVRPGDDIDQTATPAA